MSDSSTIAIVDDEAPTVRALSRLLRAKGFSVLPFHAPEIFLAAMATARVDCAVLDLSMPGLGGLEVQEQLKTLGVSLPVIFLTGQGDIPTSVRAIKAGAVNFLTKPVDEFDLLAAVHTAIAESSRARASDHALADLRARAANLTPRELEVLQHVIAGRLNKQIAATLGVGEQTVKVHRMHITEKLAITSVAELVRAAARLEINPVTVVGD